MKPRTRTWKRTLLTLSLFILAGAIINVAVAWGCAATIKLGDYTYARHRVGDGEWMGYKTTQYGHQLYVSCWFSRQSPKIVEGSEFQSFMPQWAHVVIPPEDPPKLVAYLDLHHFHAAGIPMPCFFSEYSFIGIAGRGTWKLKGGIQTIPNPTIHALEPPYSGVLPYVPLWPGFAINTIFYAGILWLLFTAPGFVRRRIRIKRGLCPACAYPVGASDVCTECGMPVTPRPIQQ